MESNVKVGDLVCLVGSIMSSYKRQGCIGILISKSNRGNHGGYPDVDFGEVMWCNDNTVGMVKCAHLEKI